LIVWFETSGRDFSYAQLFVISFFSRQHGGVSHQWKVNSRIRHQIGLQKQKQKQKQKQNNKISLRGHQDDLKVAK
jgi:hypothetical protein